MLTDHTNPNNSEIGIHLSLLSSGYFFLIRNHRIRLKMPNGYEINKHAQYTQTPDESANQIASNRLPNKDDPGAFEILELDVVVLILLELKRQITFFNYKVNKFGNCDYKSKKSGCQNVGNPFQHRVSRIFFSQYDPDEKACKTE